RPGPGHAPGRQAPAQGASWPGPGAHPGLRGPALRQSLWRQGQRSGRPAGTLVGTEGLALHRLLVCELPEIPAFACVSAHDAGAGARLPRPCRRRPGPPGPVLRRLRPRTALLLSLALVRDQRRGHRPGLRPLPAGRLDVRDTGRRRRAAGLRLQFVGGLRSVARRGAVSFPALLLVRRRQTPLAGGVAELSVALAFLSRVTFHSGTSFAQNSARPTTRFSLFSIRSRPGGTPWARSRLLDSTDPAAARRHTGIAGRHRPAGCFWNALKTAPCRPSPC